MLVGYGRVSTAEQELALQEDALRDAGCERIFVDKASGVRSDRPGLTDALDFVRSGDTLVVWRLDRLGRSLTHLIQIVNDLEKRQVSFKSLTETIDTTTGVGKLVFHLFGSLAQFERDLTSERTQAGLKAARARGRTGGHPRAQGLNTPQKVAIAQSMYANKATPIADICSTLRVSKSTLYRYIKPHREEVISK